jgi:small redox-active disulfide protein 2
VPQPIRVLVLGAGCAKCNALAERIRTLADDHQIPVTIEKITDLQEIMHYGILMTPGLVIEGTLRSYGIIPPEKQLLEWITGAST